MIPPLAHPLTQVGQALPVPPVVLGLLGVAVVFLVDRVAPAVRSGSADPGRDADVAAEGAAVEGAAVEGAAVEGAAVEGAAVEGAAVEGTAVGVQAGSRPVTVIGRTLGLAVLVLGITAGLFGDPEQLRNIAPALIIGVGWPALLIQAALFGRVWRLVNPFDSVARLTAMALGPTEGGPSSAEGWTVWGALPAAVIWTAYLTVLPDPLDPRTVGSALAAYTLVTVAGTAVWGADRWIWSAELFTVVNRLAVRSGRGAAPGSTAVFGTLTVGLLFGLIRPSALWFSVGGPQGGVLVAGPSPGQETLLAIIGLAVALALGIVGTRALEQWSRRVGTVGAVIAALPPLVVGVGICQALVQDRLFTAAQLVVELADTPLGGDATIVAEPLGAVGRNALQFGVLVIAGVVALVRAREITIQTRAMVADAGRRDPSPGHAARPETPLAAQVLVGIVVGVAVTAITAVR